MSVMGFFLKILNSLNISLFFTLTLPATCVSESYIEIKINWNIYFYSSLSHLKRLRSGKIKLSVNFSSRPRSGWERLNSITDIWQFHKHASGKNVSKIINFFVQSTSSSNLCLIFFKGNDKSFSEMVTLIVKYTSAWRISRINSFIFFLKLADITLFKVNNNHIRCIQIWH